MAGTRPVQQKKFRSRKRTLPAVALARHASVESKRHPPKPVVTAWPSGRLLFEEQVGVYRHLNHVPGISLCRPVPDGSRRSR